MAFGSDILGLLRSAKLGFSDPFVIAVEVAYDVDIVVDAGGVLPRQHRRARGCAVGLGIGVGETQAVVGQLLQGWRAKSGGAYSSLIAGR